MLKRLCGLPPLCTFYYRHRLISCHLNHENTEGLIDKQTQSIWVSPGIPQRPLWFHFFFAHPYCFLNITSAK
jgi:hypothetical protein